MTFQMELFYDGTFALIESFLKLQDSHKYSQKRPQSKVVEYFLYLCSKGAL